MILAIDELEGKALDYAYEKARAYTLGWDVRQQGHWKWPIENGYMIAGHSTYGRALPYVRRHSLSDAAMRAAVHNHVGELVVVPGDLVSPVYRQYQHVIGEPRPPRLMPVGSQVREFVHPGNYTPHAATDA